MKVRTWWWWIFLVDFCVVSMGTCWWNTLLVVGPSSAIFLHVSMKPHQCTHFQSVLLLVHTVGLLVVSVATDAGTVETKWPVVNLFFAVVVRLAYLTTPDEDDRKLWISRK